MKKLDFLAATLVLVGGLNWGLVAVAKFDLVAWICGGMDFGETNAASRVIYGLVGLAAVYGIGSLLTAGRRMHTRAGLWAIHSSTACHRAPPEPKGMSGMKKLLSILTLLAVVGSVAVAAAPARSTEAVAAGGNGFALIQAVSRFRHPERLPAVAPPPVP
jgi:uncharacterized protein